MKAVSLTRLCTLGVGQLTSMALHGELRAKHVWIALAGGQTYRKRYAEGDRAPLAVAQDRAEICLACPHAHRYPLTAIEGEAVFCGPRFAPDAAQGTCGCLVATLDGGGVPHPGGKGSIASEACPQGVWGAVTVHGKPIGGDPSAGDA